MNRNQNRICTIIENTSNYSNVKIIKVRRSLSLKTDCNTRSNERIDDFLSAKVCSKPTIVIESSSKDSSFKDDSLLKTNRFISKVYSTATSPCSLPSPTSSALSSSSKNRIESPTEARIDLQTESNPPAKKSIEFLPSKPIVHVTSNKLSSSALPPVYSESQDSNLRTKNINKQIANIINTTNTAVTEKLNPSMTTLRKSNGSLVSNSSMSSLSSTTSLFNKNEQINEIINPSSLIKLNTNRRTPNYSNRVSVDASMLNNILKTIDHNDNNNLDNKNELGSSASSSSASSSSSTSSSSNFKLNDLNLAGVTWSVPNIRKQFEKQQSSLDDTSNNSPSPLGFEPPVNKIKPKYIPPQSAAYNNSINQSSSINENSNYSNNHHHNNHYVYKDSNGNPTTYI